MASMTCSGAVLMAASVASADHGNDCNPTQLPSPQVARRLEFSRSRSSLHVTHYEEVGTVNATGQRHLGQRVRAHALTRGLAVHGVCTASQLRFQRGSKACVHGATCVQWFRKGRVTDASDDIDRVSGEARNPGPQPPPLHEALATSAAASVGDALALPRVPNGYSHTPYSQVPGWAAVAQFIATDPNAFGSQRVHSAMVAFNVCAANLGVHTLHPNQTLGTARYYANSAEALRQEDEMLQMPPCSPARPGPA